MPHILILEIIAESEIRVLSVVGHNSQWSVIFSLTINPSPATDKKDAQHNTKSRVCAKIELLSLSQDSSVMFCEAWTLQILNLSVYWPYRDSQSRCSASEVDCRLLFALCHHCFVHWKYETRIKLFMTFGKLWKNYSLLSCVTRDIRQSPEIQGWVTWTMGDQMTQCGDRVIVSVSGMSEIRDPENWNSKRLPWQCWLAKI